MNNRQTKSRIKEYEMDQNEQNESSNPRTADLSALKINRPKEQKYRSYKWMKVIPWILIPALLVVGYFFLIDKLKQGITVDVTTVRLVKGSSAKATLSASGYVVAQRQSSVASKATGRVVYLAVEEGDEVQKGEIIAKVESEDIQANLDLARANLDYALADSVQAASQFARNQELLNAGSITEDQFESYKALYDKSIATLKARRAQVNAATIDLDNTNIRAPFTGKVIRKIAEIGDIVAPFASSASSAGAVVSLADMSSLEVEADVSESNIQKVKMNQPCEIVLDAYSDVKYTGYVKNIVPTANRASATIMTRIAFDQLDSLIYPEMSARVYFMNPEHEAVTVEEPSFIGVSQNAIKEDEAGKYAYLIKGDYVEKRPIEVGKTVGRMVEVKSGLAVDDEVVLTPPGRLKDGDKIKISN